MPEIKISVCDECNKELPEERFLIYNISFWNNKTFEVDRIDFLRKNDIALMLCSKECVGNYISKMIGDKKS
jgi:hypothetical protein